MSLTDIAPSLKPGVLFFSPRALASCGRMSRIFLRLILPLYPEFLLTSTLHFVEAFVGRSGGFFDARIGNVVFHKDRAIWQGERQLCIVRHTRYAHRLSFDVLPNDPCLHR